MIADEYVSLVGKLLDRTKSGEVNWKSTANENEFMVYFKKFSLSVSSSYDNHSQEEQYVISLRNESGAEIDRFWLEPHEEQWKTASELYIGARRKALKIDDALSLIMSELESDGSVGLEEKPEKKNKSGFEDFDDDIPF